MYSLALQLSAAFCLSRIGQKRTKNSRFKIQLETRITLLYRYDQEKIVITLCWVRISECELLYLVLTPTGYNNSNDLIWSKLATTFFDTNSNIISSQLIIIIILDLKRNKQSAARCVNESTVIDGKLFTKKLKHVEKMEQLYFLILIQEIWLFLIFKLVHILQLTVSPSLCTMYPLYTGLTNNVAMPKVVSVMKVLGT